MLLLAPIIRLFWIRPHNPANGALAIQSYSYWYSDDWSWVAIPQCETPLNVGSTAITASSLDFSWTHSGGNAQSYNIEYGPSGFTQGTGTTMTSTGSSVQLNGLAANTLYDVYVQADCGGSGNSGWSNVATAQTACGSETAPWSDDFESYSTGTSDRFGCWTQDQSSSNSKMVCRQWRNVFFWHWSFCGQHHEQFFRYLH